MTPRDPLSRNVLIFPDTFVIGQPATATFEGEWVAVPREDFDAARAALATTTTPAPDVSEAPQALDALAKVKADIEYRLQTGLRHVPGATESEERHYNDGQAFGLRYAIERIDAALPAPGPTLRTCDCPAVAAGYSFAHLRDCPLREAEPFA